VSDLLSRLAARAVGAVPTARPRLPARFEITGGLEEHAEDDGTGVAVEGKPGRSTEFGAKPAGPVAPPHPADVRPAERTRREPPDDAEPAPAPRMAVPAPMLQVGPPLVAGAPVTGPVPVASVAQAAGPPAESDQAAAIPASQDTDAPAPVAAAVRAAPVRPAEPAAEPRPPAVRPGSVPAADADPGPVVRITIGRLEVRANLVDSSPATPGAEGRGDKPPRLSLTDYLRGAR
jgi:hypothetical protein